MLEKEQQVKNSILYLLPIIASSLLPLLTLPVVSRFLTPEDYGLLALAQIYSSFVSSLSNFGLIVIYNRNYFEYRDECGKSILLYSLLAFVFIVHTFFLVLTLLAADLLSTWIIGSGQHGLLLFLALCLATVSSLKAYFFAYFKNIEDAKIYSKYTIVELFLGTVTTLVLIVIFKTGVVGILLGQLLAGIPVLICLEKIARKRLIFALDFSILFDSLKLSFPLVPRIFLSVLSSQADKYLIGLLGTIGAVGAYSIGQRISSFVFVFMTSVHNVYSPQIYKTMFELGGKGGESIGRYLTPYIYISIFFALLVGLFSQELLVILTPQEYHLAIDISTIICLYYGFLFFNMQPQLLFSKKIWQNSVQTIVGIVLTIIICIPFTLRFGVIGTAWGTFLSGLITCGVSYAVSQRYYRIIWEYKKVIAILALFSGSLILLILLRMIGAPYLLMLGFKILGLAAYTLVGVRAGIITKDNLRSLSHALRIKKGVQQV